MIRFAAIIAIARSSALCLLVCAPLQGKPDLASVTAAGIRINLRSTGVDKSQEAAKMQNMSDDALKSALGYNPIRHGASLGLIREYYRKAVPRPLTIHIDRHRIKAAHVAVGTIDVGSGVPVISVLIYLFDPPTHSWRLSYYRPSDGRANGYRFQTVGDAIRVVSPVIGLDGKHVHDAIVASVTLDQLRRNSAVELPQK